jgi:hypothetical protein
MDYGAGATGRGLTEYAVLTTVSGARPGDRGALRVLAKASMPAA